MIHGKGTGVLLAQAGNSAAAVVAGAIIAGSAAILTGVLAYVFQRNISNRQAEEAAQVRHAEYVLRQVNQLYAPLMLMRSQSKQYWDKLRGGDPDWRLLDHLAEVRSNQGKLALANILVSINKRCEDLILDNSGLIHGLAIPESFHVFMSHCGIVKVAVETGEVPGGDFVYYPPEFDEDLLAAHRELKLLHHRLTSAKDPG